MTSKKTASDVVKKMNLNDKFFLITGGYTGLWAATTKAKTPDEGAATQTMVATLPDNLLVNGAYYADCKIIQ